MLDLTWQKSSFSTNDPHGDCVELAAEEPGVILLRESDLPYAVLTTGRAIYARLLDRLKSGDPILTRPDALRPDAHPPPRPDAAPPPPAPLP